MKKLLGILVLGLILTGTSYADNEAEKAKDFLKSISKKSLTKKESKKFVLNYAITLKDERKDGIVTYIFDEENYERYMILNVAQFNITSMIQRYNIIGRLKHQVSKLQQLELPEQRSLEWYALRRGMLTASSLAAALGDDFFKSRNELILEKVESKEIPFIPNPITEWGVKYEEIATKFYEKMNNLKIIEFGLIPHPDFTIFGASPDGICSSKSINKN